MAKSRMREAMDKRYPWVDVKTLDGVKQYQFTLLDVPTGQDLYHEIISSILGGIVAAVGEKSTGSDRIAAIKSVDVQTKNRLVTTLLSNCVVRPDPSNPANMISIRDPRSDEYFRDNNEELYFALWAAIGANFPNSLRRLRTALEGFGPKVEAAIRQKLDTLSQPDE